MPSQLPISLLATLLAITSPVLCYWERAVEASTRTESDCCDDCHDAGTDGTPDAPEQSSGDQQNCDCKYRVAVPQSPSWDIAEMAAEHLPGDQLLVVFNAVRAATEVSFGPLFDAPVHFPLAADGGELCARLGRYLF